MGMRLKTSTFFRCYMMPGGYAVRSDVVKYITIMDDARGAA
jgi:hypothetical protein